MSRKTKAPLAQLISKDGNLVAIGDEARIPNFERSSTTGSVSVKAYSISVHNAGVATGTVLGTNILAGETLSFDAGGSGCMFKASSFTYDGTGTDLAIIYTT